MRRCRRRRGLGWACGRGGGKCGAVLGAGSAPRPRFVCRRRLILRISRRLLFGAPCASQRCAGSQARSNERRSFDMFTGNRPSGRAGEAVAILARLTISASLFKECAPSLRMMGRRSWGGVAGWFAVAVRRLRRDMDRRTHAYSHTCGRSERSTRTSGRSSTSTASRPAGASVANRTATSTSTRSAEASFTCRTAARRTSARATAT